MFTLPPLPYDYSALEPFIDTETMKLHHDKHHQAYVDNLNKALEPYPELLNSDPSELILNLSKVPEEVRQKVRNNLGGHVNHSLFWQMMAPATEATVPQFITDSFGSVEEFQEKLSAAGMGRFGSGWAWLVKVDSELKIMDTPNQDNPLMDDPNIKVLLGVDVWEHAYYLKYQNKRADYIKAWFNLVNWNFVSKLYEQA